MKTLAIFAGYFYPHLGGIEEYSRNLAKKLNDLGYRIIIVTSNHGNLPFVEDGDVKIYRLPIYALFKKRYPILRKNRQCKKLLKEIMAEEIDLIILQARFYLISYLASRIAKRKQIPSLLIEHGSAHFSVGNKILDFLGQIYEHALTNKVSKNIGSFYGASEASNKWLEHFGIKSKGTLPNAIDKKYYDLFKNRHFLEKDDEIVISYVGKIIEEKGVEELLKAFLPIAKRFPRARLVIAGNGARLNAYRNKYTNKRIKFTGEINHDEVMSLLNDTDVFVYPSHYPDAISTAILEAGLMKCTVIATDSGGTKEIINAPEYGIITEGKSEKIEKKIRFLLDNPTEMKKLQENLHRRIIKVFTWESTIQKIVEIIEEEK